MENTGYLVGVVALIQREDGKVLMGLRPKEKVWAGFGGKLEAGESAEEGLRREVREEVGIELATVTPMSFGSGVKSDGEHFVALYFHATMVPGSKPVLREAHAAEALRWIDLSDLPENVWERERSVLAKLVRLKQ